MAWIIENLATLIVGLLLLSAVVAIAAFMIRKKKKGQSFCGCGCSGCPMNGKCH